MGHVDRSAAARGCRTPAGTFPSRTPNFANSRAKGVVARSRYPFAAASSSCGLVLRVLVRPVAGARAADSRSSARENWGGGQIGRPGRCLCMERFHTAARRVLRAAIGRGDEGGRVVSGRSWSRARGPPGVVCLWLLPGVVWAGRGTDSAAEVKIGDPDDTGTCACGIALLDGARSRVCGAVVARRG